MPNLWLGHRRAVWQVSTFENVVHRACLLDSDTEEKRAEHLVAIEVAQKPTVTTTGSATAWRKRVDDESDPPHLKA